MPKSRRAQATPLASSRSAGLGPPGRQPPIFRPRKSASRFSVMSPRGPGPRARALNVCLFCSDSYFDAARRRQCVNSVPRRMSGAHAPRSAIPHMSRQGCEPARCVHRAASGSRRQGVVGVDYPDTDSCPRRMSRTHARTGGRRANGVARLPLAALSASRFKLAGQARHLEADGRSACV